MMVLHYLQPTTRHQVISREKSNATSVSTSKRHEQGRSNITSICRFNPLRSLSANTMYSRKKS
ncbi:hypothetical protein Mapa_006573 [Marchantia paleacea]|nr:hypothetical protein Mapa_006573 [Marchantia paleacea]